MSLIFLFVLPFLSGCIIPIIKDKPESWAEVKHVSNGCPDLSGVYKNIGVADNERCSPNRHGGIRRECLLSVVLELIYGMGPFVTHAPPVAEFINTKVAIGKNIDGLIPVKIYENESLLKQFKWDTDKYAFTTCRNDGLVIRTPYHDIDYLELKRGADKSIMMHTNVSDIRMSPPYGLPAGTIMERWYKWESIE